MGRWLASTVLACAACYAPQLAPGAPCVDDRGCPAPLVCAAPTLTCERLSDGGAITGCGAAGEAPCAANDTATGAIDVTVGGTFSGDVGLARDDVADPGCGGDGGRDLFYRVTLAAPQVYYFDTFTSALDTVVRVYGKPCADVGAGAGAAACQDDACGGVQSQVAVSLPVGESCVVVDAADATTGMGAFVLRVVPGGLDGQPLTAGMQTSSGDTCGAPDTTDPLNQSCDGPGPGGARDDRYFFTTCPGQSMLLDATMCPPPPWDAVLYVTRAAGPQLACNDDTCGNGPQITDATITGGTLYYLFVDGFDPADCGPYTLDTFLR